MIFRPPQFSFSLGKRRPEVEVARPEPLDPLAVAVAPREL